MKRSRQVWHQYRIGNWLRFALFFLVLLFMLQPATIDRSRHGIIEAQLQGYEFNYVAWEVGALWEKGKQMLWGYTPYIDSATQKEIVIDYLMKVGELQTLEGQIEATYTSPTPDSTRADLIRQRDSARSQILALQPYAEPIIEQQVSLVLAELGFEVGGQVIPPVKFRFVIPPDILIISPRSVIRQDFDFSLRPLTPEEAVAIETRVENAAPAESARVTSIGGVGIYPAMVEEARYAAYAYEVVAHEWAHHYLFMYPLGQQYLAAPETRIINETTATIFGNVVGVQVLAHFYADEVAQGLVWVPDYPTLEDFFPKPTPPAITREEVQNRARLTADYLVALNMPEAAQATLDTWSAYSQTIPLAPTNEYGTTINRTRLTTDYLLQLGYIEAAEDNMALQGQRLGIRRLNQAWFAFYGGYQSDPGSGGGVDVVITDVLDPNYRGDPIGPAIQEIYERSATPYDFLVRMRGITTRPELLELLATMRNS